MTAPIRTNAVTRADAADGLPLAFMNPLLEINRCYSDGLGCVRLTTRASAAALHDLAEFPRLQVWVRQLNTAATCQRPLSSADQATELSRRGHRAILGASRDLARTHALRQVRESASLRRLPSAQHRPSTPLDETVPSHQRHPASRGAAQ